MSNQPANESGPQESLATSPGILLSTRSWDSQRVVAALLVILQACALGYYFFTPVFSTIVIAAAVFATVTKTRLLSSRLAQRLPITLVILYAIQRTLVSTSWSAGEQGFLIPDAALIVEYLLVYQVVRFFVRSEDDGLPSFLPILAIVAVVIIGDTRVDPLGRKIYQLISLGLVILVLAFYMFRRRSVGDARARFSRGHVGWLIAVGGICMVAAWVSASGLYRYARQIEDTMNAFINPSLRPDSAGFSGTGRIGSVARQKGSSGDRVALRVYSSQQPGYLRGKAFGFYQQGQWQRESQPTQWMPTDYVSDYANDADRVFEFIEDGSNQSDQSFKSKLDIWPNQSFREVLFTPLGVTRLEAPVEKVSIDIHRIITAETMPPDTGYVAWRSRNDGVDSIESPTLKPSDWTTLTALPDKLDPRIVELAREIVGEAVTTNDKIAAIENFFLDNFEYQFGIDVPSGVDPIAYFLIQRPPAHCEFFASGAALLLRSVGVPCRYVTGLVAVEKNEIGDYWVARNRDAHAWAEAFDPERGWVLVEATPASGLPQSMEISRTKQFWDAVQAWWVKLVASIRAGGIGRFLWSGLNLMIRPMVLIGLAMLVFAIAFRYWFRRRSKANVIPTDPKVQAIQRLLDQMDRRWERAGVGRSHHETMHQFAARLEANGKTPDHEHAADWYRQFAIIRYSGRVDSESIEMLRNQMDVGDLAKHVTTETVAAG